MNGEEIIALVLSSLIIIMGGILIIIYAMKVIPKIEKFEEEQTYKDLIKARAELKQYKKLIKSLYAEVIRLESKEAGNENILEED